MRKFLKKIFILLLLVIGLDFVIGLVSDYSVSKIHHGNIGKSNYINDSLTSDVIILGSSRAARHYNPKILTDSLHLSCYNCGEPGYGIVFNYGRYQMIKDRHIPKVILYDLHLDFDVRKNDNNQYLAQLRPYYQREGIAEIFSTVDKKNKIKMLSNLYRYNSIWLQYLTNYLGIRNGEMNYQGFMPMYGSIDKMKIRKEENGEIKIIEKDELKSFFMDSFIKSSSESLVFFVISPYYNKPKDEEIKEFYQLAQKYNKQIIDFSQHPDFTHNPNYFKDGAHLNSVGADEFSRKLSHVLIKLIAQNDKEQ